MSCVVSSIVFLLFVFQYPPSPQGPLQHLTSPHQLSNSGSNSAQDFLYSHHHKPVPVAIKTSQVRTNTHIGLKLLMIPCWISSAQDFCSCSSRSKNSSSSRSSSSSSSSKNSSSRRRSSSSSSSRSRSSSSVVAAVEVVVVAAVAIIVSSLSLSLSS